MILLHMEGKLCQGDLLAVDFSVTKNPQSFFREHFVVYYKKTHRKKQEER